MRGKRFTLKSLEPKEFQIENQILHYLVHFKRLFAWKNPSAGYFDAKIGKFKRHASPFVRKGVPDIICIYHGLFLGFEVKSRLGRQSDEQKRFQEDVEKAMGFYFLVRSLADVEEAFKTIEAMLP